MSFGEGNHPACSTAKAGETPKTCQRAALTATGAKPQSYPNTGGRLIAPEKGSQSRKVLWLYPATCRHVYMHTASSIAVSDLLSPDVPKRTCSRAAIETCIHISMASFLHQADVSSRNSAMSTETLWPVMVIRYILSLGSCQSNS
jgi:hypothetical protein